MITTTGPACGPGVSLPCGRPRYLRPPLSARAYAEMILLHERMADDVLLGEFDKTDLLDPAQDAPGFDQAGLLAPRQVDLVTSPVMTILEPKPSRVRNIFICSGVVFCASSRMMKESSSVRPRM